MVSRELLIAQIQADFRPLFNLKSEKHNLIFHLKVKLLLDKH